MHILLCGERQVGKSTMIRRLLQENRLPVYGPVTAAAGNCIRKYSTVWGQD